MDADGLALTVAGQKQEAQWFAGPATLYLDQFIVVKDFVVSDGAVDGTKAEVFAEYIYLGQLDPERGRYSLLPDVPQYVKVREYFKLALTENSGRGVWKIMSSPDKPSWQPHITVQTAIRYVTELHDRTSDAAIKKNAERTLASLKRLESDVR